MTQIDASRSAAPLYPRPFQVIERGGAPAIVRGGALAATIATVQPYRPEAERAARDLVDHANRYRETVCALRLLYSAAHAFQRRPGVKSWRDLSNAIRVARAVLSGSA